MGIWPKPKTPAQAANCLNALAVEIGALRRSPFVQPPFVRTAWVSDAAREALAPKFAAICDAWTDIEWRSAGKVRPCALVLFPRHEFRARHQAFEAHGLSIEVLRVDGEAPSDVVHSAVGARRDVGRYRKAWIRGDADAMGALMGYPACCRAFFAQVFVEARLADPSWWIARATERASVEGHTVTLAGAAETNVLLRRLGLRAVPHFPCSFRCSETRAFARTLIDFGRTLGHGDAFDTLMTVLDWPLAWSSRNGIAEIRTPVLKIATHTDAIPHTLRLHWQGQTWPSHAARGLGFPYLRQA